MGNYENTKTEYENAFVEERKKHIEMQFMHLNEMQRQAVLATEGPLLILAGAGSGKTTVLINRIYNILKFGCGSDSDEIPYYASEDSADIISRGGDEADRLCALHPAQPWQILAITFTNKAAGELKTRLGNMLGESADDIWACTFHSACVRILRRDADRLGYSKSFTIYDTSDTNSLLRQIIKELDLDEKFYAPKAVAGEISRAKDALIDPPKYIKQASFKADLYHKKVGEIYARYMESLKKSDAMDFDDLIFNTVKLLDSYSEVREYWQNRFRYILVDEYQDTNNLQYYLVSLLTNDENNICVVGDDDQSIYKFRGATIENILNFESNFEDCRTIRLEQNYRSTGHILEAANAVISHNLGRKGKTLWTAKNAGDPVELFVADSERDEAQYIVSKILSGYGSGGKWRDYAVLYRMNAQSNSIEYALKSHNIPYRIVGGTRFFDRAEVKDILAYMCVVLAPNDNLRLQRIINVPARGIGLKSVETALEIGNDNDLSLFDVISHAQSYEQLTRPAARMKEFANMIGELQSFAACNSPADLFDELIEKTGYIRMLQEKKTKEDEARIENVMELKSTMLTYMNESGDSTLEGYLANVALYTDLDNYDNDSDAVTLMTMHASKGLEFPYVFIAGMEETIFPSSRAIGEADELEEERRLCYVAVTRAMKNLYLVAARQRLLFGRTNCNRVSRFVDEIPDEHIKKNIPKGFAYKDPATAYFPGGSRYSGAYEPDNVPQYDTLPGKSYSYSKPKQKITPAPAAKQEKPMLQLELGDNVRHKAFGIGVVVKMMPMGGDYLIEINFETQGSKKLMLKAASLFLEKV